MVYLNGIIMVIYSWNDDDWWRMTDENLTIDYKIFLKSFIKKCYIKTQLNWYKFA